MWILSLQWNSELFPNTTELQQKQITVIKMPIFRPCQTSSNAICSCQQVPLITKCIPTALPSPLLLAKKKAKVDKKHSHPHCRPSCKAPTTIFYFQMPIQPWWRKEKEDLESTNFLKFRDGMASLLQDLERQTFNFVRSSSFVICLQQVWWLWVVFFFVYLVFLLLHLTLNKCKLVQVGPKWYFGPCICLEKFPQRKSQSLRLKAQLQRENLVIYQREKRSGLVMILLEIESIFLHYVWLTVNRGC